MQKIALVGKPNVGKSTLFNRIVEKKQSIVCDQPGVTRDRIYGNANWLNREFNIIDTGGITKKSDSFQESIKKQVDFAIDEANIIFFVVSKKDGVNNDDYLIGKLLKKSKNKKIIVVVNKSETNSLNEEKKYYSFGFGKPFYISAEHGQGIGDLLDYAVKSNKMELTNKTIDDRFPFCIIGKPNVGKSSLVNAITNSERVIVSNVAGTTRDSIDCDFSYNKSKFTIIDTAGIRRKGKIQDDIEKYSVLRAENSIKRSKLIILVLDGNQPISEQDEIVGGLAYKANIPVIIAINKWDLIEKDTLTMNKYKNEIKNHFQYLAWAPIVFISAKENKRINTLFEAINEIKEQLKINVSTSLLNDVIAKAQMFNQPPSFKGGRIKINYATQVKGQIPTFVMFCNNPKYLHFTYARYIENKIRESFEINKVPITVYYKDKNARNRTGEQYE